MLFAERLSVGGKRLREELFCLVEPGLRRATKSQASSALPIPLDDFRRAPGAATRAPVRCGGFRLGIETEILIGLADRQTNPRLDQRLLVELAGDAGSARSSAVRTLEIGIGRLSGRAPVAGAVCARRSFCRKSLTPLVIASASAARSVQGWRQHARA